MTLSKFKVYSMKMTEKQFELGPRCCTLVLAPGSACGGSLTRCYTMAFALEPSCGGFLSLATATSDACSPFLPAELVYSVVLGPKGGEQEILSSDSVMTRNGVIRMVDYNSIGCFGLSHMLNYIGAKREYKVK